MHLVLLQSRPLNFMPTQVQCGKNCLLWPPNFRSFSYWVNKDDCVKKRDGARNVAANLKWPGPCWAKPPETELILVSMFPRITNFTIVYTEIQRYLSYVSWLRFVSCSFHYSKAFISESRKNLFSYVFQSQNYPPNLPIIL